MGVLALRTGLQGALTDAVLGETPSSVLGVSSQTIDVDGSFTCQGGATCNAALRLRAGVDSCYIEISFEVTPSAKGASGTVKLSMPEGCANGEQPQPVPPPTGIVMNNTNFPHGDIKSYDFQLPKGTDDAAGVTACEGFCNNHSDCSAWVFVRELQNGPRCAIKGNSFCAPNAQDACMGCRNEDGMCGCISSVKLGRSAKGCGGGLKQLASMPLRFLDSETGQTATTVKLRVLLDKSVIEVYAQDGRSVLSHVVLPSQTLGTEVQLLSTGEASVSGSAHVYGMGSAYIGALEQERVLV